MLSHAFSCFLMLSHAFSCFLMRSHAFSCVRSGRPAASKERGGFGGSPATREQRIDVTNDGPKRIIKCKEDQ